MVRFLSICVGIEGRYWNYGYAMIFGQPDGKLRFRLIRTSAVIRQHEICARTW